MKKQYAILLFYFVFSVICYGQKVRNISLHYEAEDFPIEVNSAGKLIIKSTKHVITFKSDLSKPALPYIGINVLIAPSEEYVSVSLTGNDITIREGYEIVHNPVELPSNMAANLLFTEKTAPFQSAIYPNKNIEYTGTSKMGGYKILTFLVSPFKYDVVNKQLIFISDIAINLSTSGNAFGGKIGPMSDEVEKLVVNNNELKDLYNEESFSECIGQKGRTSQSYEYIIVTNSSLKPTFQKLADWKTQKGVLTKILTVEEISSGYSGNSLQAKIKNALKYYYDNTQHALTYVLLGGDTNIVPALLCYGRYWYYDYSTNPATLINHYTNAPTDLYYGCFDTMDWDSDGDGVFGEIEDNVDIQPEIYVTRVSVSGISDTDAFVSRVISYESNPNWNSNTSKALMVGAKAYVNYYDSSIGDSVSDSHYKSDWLYNDYISPYWNGTKVRFYDTGTDFTGGASYQLNGLNLQTQLANGYGFVHVETHGTDMSWILENSTSYSTNEALELNNNGPTIVLTTACYTNAFQYGSYCLSEPLMRNANSGILAYVGSSDYGWYYKAQDNLGTSNMLNGEIFKRIMSQSDNNLGKIVTEAKNVFINNCSTYQNTYRWLLFFVNPMGDPEMPIYKASPLPFSNIIVSNSGGVISVNTNVSGCRICITGRNGNTTFLVGKNTSTFSSSALPNGEYNVCVTKPGYIPYNVRIGINQDVYIQNETFATNVGIIAPNVKIGKDVNTTATQGPVTIENGKMNIKLQNEVFIKNNFEVKLGAVLEIEQ